MSWGGDSRSLGIPLCLVVAGVSWQTSTPHWFLCSLSPRTCLHIAATENVGNYLHLHHRQDHHPQSHSGRWMYQSKNRSPSILPFRVSLTHARALRCAFLASPFEDLSSRLPGCCEQISYHCVFLVLFCCFPMTRRPSHSPNCWRFWISHWLPCWQMLLSTFRALWIIELLFEIFCDFLKHLILLVLAAVCCDCHHHPATCLGYRRSYPASGRGNPGGYGRGAGGMGPSAISLELQQRKDAFGSVSLASR
mmetsp:Transcript_22422/g.51693  ORF Transcript_22422/g.51693 Transcript_22422/m.51693 type:complete len:250 (+) Transcript_22422:129-878(+)